MSNQVRNKLGEHKRKRIQRLALNTGAILGSLCLFMTLAALLFGLKPLVFVSGSMGPAIPTGSLGLAVPTPVEDVAVGDVVSVVTSEQVRVTHRVVDKVDAGLILKGDANPVADLHPYAVDDVDKLLVSAPGLGYLVTWLSQPWAYFLGGLLCAYLLYISFARNETAREIVPEQERPSQAVALEVGSGIRAEPDQRMRTSGIGARHVLGVVLVLAMAVAALQLHPAKILSCTNKSSLSGNNVITFTWQAPIAQNAKLTGYKVSVQVNNSEEKFSDPLPASTTTYAVDISPSGGLLSFLIDLLGNLFGSKFDVNFRVYAMYDNGWISAPSVYSGAKGSIGLLGVVRSLHCS